MPRARLATQGPSSEAAPQYRPCDHPGCIGAGDYRAPRARDSLHSYYWFCLDHVREYNLAWNYYAGMTPEEIEAEIRNDTVWQRPTWPLGMQMGARRGERFEDFGLFGMEEEADAERRHRDRRRPPPSPQAQALAIFQLDPPFTLAALKQRYKTLVKLHHPDAHGGDKAAEERLKAINQAYSTLKTSYFS